MARNRTDERAPDVNTVAATTETPGAENPTINQESRSNMSKTSTTPRQNPSSNVPVPAAPRFVNTNPMPARGICEAIDLGVTSSDSARHDVSVRVQRAVDAEGGTYCVTVDVANWPTLVLPEESISHLIVMLVAARAAIDLDRGELTPTTRTSHATAGCVDDVSGRPFHVGSQRFQWQQEPAEHNVLLGGGYDAIKVAELPEFVRLLLVASHTASVGAPDSFPDAVDLDGVLRRDEDAVRADARVREDVIG